MDKFKCKECEREFTTLKGINGHRLQKHGITSQQTYNEYVLNGISPTCECGCGEKPTYLGISKGYRDFIRGHSQRVNNNWGHNPEALKKSHYTQKEMYDSGELTIWNKGLTVDDPRVRDNIDKVMSNPDRGKNISKALSGVPKSEEHKQKLSDTAKIRWADPEERKKQSKRRIKTMIKNNYRNNKTNLEEKFESLLDFMGLKNVYQFDLDYGLFDFYLTEHKILIEVDGDFHHCNPNVHGEPTYPIQFNTIENDKRKNKIAESNNIKLLRFWESDINNNPEIVIETLKKELL